MKSTITFSIDVEGDPFSQNEEYFQRFKTFVKKLEEENVSVTLFVTGEMLEKYPNVFKELSKKHEIASHSYDHKNYSNMTFKEKCEDIRKSIKLIKKITGKKPSGFRAPRLKIDSKILEFLRKEGFLYDSSNSILQGKLDQTKLTELRPIPNFFLKFPFGKTLISLPKREYKVIFLHPWEFVKPKNLNGFKERLKIYNYYGNGPKLEAKILKFIKTLKNKYKFNTCEGFVRDKKNQNN